MSARALTWCWQQEPRTTTQKLVLAAMADRADDDGLCFPSLDWIAEKCKPLKRDTARKAVNELEQQGLIEKVQRRRRDNGTLGTWLYRLPLNQRASLPTGNEMPLDQRDLDAAASGIPVHRRDDHKDPTIRSTSSPDGLEEPPASDDRWQPEFEGVSWEALAQTLLPVEEGEIEEQPSGSDFVAFFVDECRRFNGIDPTPTDIRRIGRGAKLLLKDGLSAETIRQAITEVVEAGLSVGALASTAGQIHRGGFRGFKRGPATAGVTGSDLDDAIARLEAAGR